MKMCTKVLFKLLFILWTHSNVQGHQKFYRKDYKYIDYLDSFFKIHTTHHTWKDAEHICTEEDASLLYPKSGKEALEFINLLPLLNEKQSYGSIVNGISNVIDKRLNEMFEGIPISELYTEWGPGPCENSKYPFICKKTSDSFEWNHECNLPISGYKYYTETDRCYKFYLQPKNWTDAAKICSKDQSYLAVINSDTEAKLLVGLTEGTPKEGLTQDYQTEAIHLGFHKIDNWRWKTIDDQDLHDSGYTKWSFGHPNNGIKGKSCGSMFYNGQLNDIGCEVKSLFICEHEVEFMSSLIGYRLEERPK